MSDFLRTMTEASRRRAALALPRSRELERSARQRSPAPPLVLDGFGLIAEVKRRSPAEGLLDSPLSVAERAVRYEAAGAAAVSVLTEPARFDGSLDDLASAADSLSAVPAMRKDFIVAPVQLYEARAAGAGGVLLIAAMLDDATLATLTGLAVELGLFVLLEAFDGQDLARIGQLADEPRFAPSIERRQLLAGVNTRDLRTLDVDPSRLERLAPALPAALPSVAESGILTPADAAHAAGLGYDAALVGTAFMRAGDPAALVAKMRSAAAS